ncbi:SoxY-related AACIE arm protein [Polynucleobacter sp. IMCC30063]|uniref:SoxY-related AACIE arm protein n=1 Tax=unclassified Polynucleobacter TaxID=2640945 RepID=UPI001F43D606|nr:MULTISPECIES: SoxY-related AACIE arm protein [unclassified Polynucleobacter]MCE7506271.1 SoxY-related AACIE arm protein [Polynucleobacter sp. IMCC30063]MCE7527551.1 SoxY-related AACIE arm protein [Polynucleobacter sp. IMCC 30228]MCE7529370.1 SoxY-related AACIE arm protein [Polynucleobacter sp. IMCC 29146]
MKNQRRKLLKALGIVGLIPVQQAHATPEEASAAINSIIGANTAKEGRVQLELASLIENGNLVVIKIRVDSPMTANDYVKAIHLVAGKNPLPNIISAYFTPLSGTANFTTRIRLADTQRVWAIAQMSDGSFYQTYADTLVTSSACSEGFI